ncbi:hypothetical protein ASC95_29660 [Pelomonas sp. Root1217]|uniref:hypothetical protein n=1 Tax=Pelomonas sp. Root1217 TaxID=1736430 RepID=UPI00070FFB4E|nr:hypothetical protein [Pelomonas sp. Root1217]KQV51705.1 hypothetical protein ASC95_29660 [Pelomonas sp. Root1217]
MDKLHAYRAEVQSRGASTAAADTLVQAIASSPDAADLRTLFAQLATESDQLGWFRDCDYAAVALQVAQAHVASPRLKEAMLRFALERARWCASCATAGGEGLARSLHVRELEALAGNDVQPFAAADGFAVR